jgi:hypothetical protein
VAVSVLRAAILRLKSTNNMAEERSVQDGLQSRSVSVDQTESGQTDVFAIEDWTRLDETKFTRYNDNTMTCTISNLKYIFKPGDKLKIISSGNSYWTYVYCVYNTYITTAGDDLPASLDEIYVSNRITPYGFQDFMGYGNGGDGSRIDGNGTLAFDSTFNVGDVWSMVGNMVYLYINITGIYSGSGSYIEAETTIKNPAAEAVGSTVGYNTYFSIIPVHGIKAASAVEDVMACHISSNSTAVTVVFEKYGGGNFTSTYINASFSGCYSILYIES